MRLLQTLKRAGRPLICPFQPILEAIPAGSAVVDIGCGGGFLLGLIAKTNAPSRLAGVEIDPDLVAAAKRYVHEQAPDLPTHISVYDGVTLPSGIGQMDVILLVDVFHHIPRAQQRDFLAAIHEQMLPGARFILKDIDAARQIFCACNKLHDLVCSGERGNEIAMSEMEHALVALGFQIQRRGAEVRLWYPHYWFICDKK